MKDGERSEEKKTFLFYFYYLTVQFRMQMYRHVIVQYHRIDLARNCIAPRRRAIYKRLRRDLAGEQFDTTKISLIELYILATESDAIFAKF